MAVSLTSWLDPVAKGFTREMGYGTESKLSTIWGGEAWGVGFEFLSDLFTKGWLNPTIQGATGLLAALYATFGRGVNPRLREELLEIGSHELGRVAKILPSEMGWMRMSAANFARAAMAGRWNVALSQVLKSPGEISGSVSRSISGSITPPVRVGAYAPGQTTPAYFTSPRGEPPGMEEELSVHTPGLPLPADSYGICIEL